MKIIVDADACPVKDIIVKIAKEYHLPVLMLADTSHVINDGYSEVKVIAQGRDAVDIALINETHKGDIVVTQDYGVASMALAKQAFGIHQNGFCYDDNNMNQLMFERHIGQKVRRGGGRTKGPQKRKPEDNIKFEDTLRQICQMNISL